MDAALGQSANVIEAPRGPSIGAIFAREASARAPQTTNAAAAVVIGCTRFPVPCEFEFSRLRPVRQPEAGQRHSGESDSEFLQCPAPRDRLSHCLGQFIE